MPIIDNNDVKVLAFAADTQAPMLVETILLRPNKNRKATDLLFSDILRIHPSAFFLLGDVVNLGYSDRQWKSVDIHLHKLRHYGVKVHAILGNHEVMGRANKGQVKFQHRFPNHKKTGYCEIVGSLAVILLNSNFKAMTPKEDAQQVKWFEKTIAKMDQDPSIEYVITCAHHSPYTNSRVVQPSVEVQERFVPSFVESKKSQLFLSGHCHAFEHYKFHGKDFMVIGGGGGLQQPLRQGIGTLADLALEYKPMFHYLTVEPMADHLKVKSYHLRKDFTGFEEGFVLDVKKYEPVLTLTGEQALKQVAAK
ncbi:MAG: metallophosphoesterase family protein [Candidatus Dadabacteria bacterium]